VPGSGRTRAPRRNNQAGHKREPKIFCCVTTRRGLRQVSPGEARPGHPGGPSDPRVQHAAGHAAYALLPHAPHELPAADAAVAAVWPPASGARVSGIPGPGSTAGSTAGPDRSCRNLGASIDAGRDADRWSKGTDRDYAPDVPREVPLPKGPPERSAKSLGHSCFISTPSLDEATTPQSLVGPRRPKLSSAPRQTLCGQNSPRPNRHYRQSPSRRSHAAGEGSRQGRRRCRYTSTGEGNEGRRLPSAAH
jgi:hypothetical protein